MQIMVQFLQGKVNSKSFFLYCRPACLGVAQLVGQVVSFGTTGMTSPSASSEAWTRHAPISESEASVYNTKSLLGSGNANNGMTVRLLFR